MAGQGRVFGEQSTSSSERFFNPALVAGCIFLLYLQTKLFDDWDNSPAQYNTSYRFSVKRKVKCKKRLSIFSKPECYKVKHYPV